MDHPPDHLDQLASDPDWRAIDPDQRKHIFAIIAEHAADEAFKRLADLLEACINACNHTLHGQHMEGNDLVLHLTDNATGRSFDAVLQGRIDPTGKAWVN